MDIPACEKIKAIAERLAVLAARDVYLPLFLLLDDIVADAAGRLDEFGIPVPHRHHHLDRIAFDQILEPRRQETGKLTAHIDTIEHPPARVRLRAVDDLGNFHGVYRRNDTRRVCHLR